jgi:hypothetical protein
MKKRLTNATANDERISRMDEAENFLFSRGRLFQASSAALHDPHAKHGPLRVLQKHIPAVSYHVIAYAVEIFLLRGC